MAVCQSDTTGQHLLATIVDRFELETAIVVIFFYQYLEKKVLLGRDLKKFLARKIGVLTEDFCMFTM